MIDFIFKNKLIIFFLSLIVVVSGVLAFSTMSIDAYPDISGVQVQIITPFAGRAAEEVEKQVTIPIERVMAAVPRAETIRSRTIFGLSLVQITFEPEVDDYWARDVVFQKLGELTLPEGATPSLGSLSTAYGEVYRYVVEGENQSPIDLRTVHEWEIIPRLLKLKGVAEVANFGGLGKQYAILLDPNKLSALGVTLDDVTAAIKKNNSSAGGAFIEMGASALVIRGIGTLQTLKELERIFIKNSSGTRVFVRDVGVARIDHIPRTGIFGINDKSDAIEGIVKMRRGENPSLVLARINDEIHQIAEDLKGRGIKVLPFYDRTELVNETIHTVSHNVLFGIVLVILTLVVFLGNIKTSLAVSLAIPFSLLFSFLMMKLTGIPVSLLSIGAVDFGIIVDGAIIMAEGMTLLHDHEKSNYLEQLKKGFRATIRPTVFSMLIIIITYVPLLSLRYIEGLLFKPMAITLCYSLVGALLFSTFLLPLLLSLPFFRSHHHESPKWIVRLRANYMTLLDKVLVARKRIVLAFSIFFIVVCSAIVPFLGTEFLPYMDEGIFWLRANFPEGISLSENAKYANYLRDKLLSVKEIAFVSTQAGRSDSGADPFPMNRMEVMIGLKNKSEWRQGLTKLKLESEIRDVLMAEFPTTKFNLTQPIIDSVTEDTNGTSANLAVEISGDDMIQLRALADKVLGILRSTKGSVNSNIEQEGPQPQLRVEIDPDKVALYQVNVDFVNNMLTSAIAGLPISAIYEGEKRFDIVTKYLPEYISSPQSLSELPIYNEIGTPIPIGKLSNIRIKEGETLIARANGQKRITVRTDIRNRSQGDFVKEAQKKFKEQVQLPLRYKVQWLGMFENLQRAQAHFTLLIPITIGLIAFVLYLSFGNFLHVLLVFLTLPFSFLGAIVFLFARGMPLSVSAGVGLSSLFGVASMYGIIYISKFRSYISTNKSLVESAKSAAFNCLIPVSLTAIVAIMGLIPAMLSTGVGSDVQRPIATVIVGGLLSAGSLTLILLPCFLVLLRPRDNT